MCVPVVSWEAQAAGGKGHLLRTDGQMDRQGARRKNGRGWCGCRGERAVVGKEENSIQGPEGAAEESQGTI